MNEMEILRRMRAGVPEPGIEELKMRTGWRPGGGRPPFRPRPVSLLPLALSGAAVLVAAAVFAFLVLGPVGGPEPGSVAVGPGPASSEGPGDTPDVMEVMGPVIEAARSQEADGGSWYTQVVEGRARAAGAEDNRYGIYGTVSYRTWTNLADGTVRSRNPSAEWHLMREEDRTAWERDGSPESWPHEPEFGWVATPRPEEDLGRLTQDRALDYAVGGRVLTYEEFRSLPSDPEELGERLLTGHRGRGPEDETSPLWFLLHLPLSPEQRSGAYTVLAGIPGLHALEEATDVSGRPAVGVAYVVEDDYAGSVEHRFLFDRETGMLLSLETVLVESGEVWGEWCEPGDVIQYWLYESMGWTDEWPE
ncbi:CU044_5270 family protein [Nocardiopsis dassonvillei]|uniref:CU044_5270 family protein n=1 Tax=Nocardiopsis dassonvillei TaxID=2014 RepID=UPI003636F791